MNINYNQNTATQSDILIHLSDCADCHVPPLDKSVNIAAYSDKLSRLSTTFEAWCDQRLIGLIAAYTNDMETRIAFLSNVSVLHCHSRTGIASKLLANCIAYCKSIKLQEIKLEVNKTNEAALRLYTKHNFLIIDKSDTKHTMRLNLYTTEDK